MKTQAYVSSEDGIIFDVSFNSGNISFKIIDIDMSEIDQLLKDIKTQAVMLMEGYKKERENNGT